jgi:hypothetical protein
MTGKEGRLSSDLADVEGGRSQSREALVRGFLLTFPVALAGGLIGAFLFWIVTALPGASRPFSHDGDLFALGLLLLFAIPTSIMTWPGLILLGFPLSWPLRHLVVRHPLPAAVALVLIGGGASTWLFNFLDRDVAFPDPGTNAYIGFSYAGATAIAWVAALHRFRRRLLIETDLHG